MKAESGKASYEARVALGKQVCDLILEKHGKRVLTVCIWGSSGKNYHWPYPYVDIIAVVRDGEEIPRKRYVYQGIVVAVDYWPESTFLRDAKRFDAGWPWLADYYRTRTVLFERDGWIQHVKKALEENERADPADAIREVVWSMMRSLCFVKIDRLQGTPAELRTNCMDIAEDSAKLVFLLNRRYAIDSFWDEVLECPIRPPDFRHLVEVAMGFVSSSEEEVADATEKLCEEMLEMARSRGVSVETSQLLV